jgi:phenylacetate-CoA ligase
LKRCDKFYGKVLENLALPVGDLLFRQGITKRLHFLRDAQFWDKEKIIQKRRELLQNLIKVAYDEVPFYQLLYDSFKIDITKIRMEEDLKRLPIIDKTLLKEGSPERIVRKTKFRIHENVTSGSTGKNFAIMEDTETEGLNRAAFLLMAEWAGWRIGEPHLQTGMTLQRGFLKRIKDIFFRCQYVSAYDLKNSILDAYLKIIEEKDIEHLWGYPGSIYYLAKRAKEVGWNISMKSIMTWGDTLTNKARVTIEEVFKKRVNDAYGCGEGIQVACQCGEEYNYHIFSMDTIVEVVDDEGNLLPHGSVGNLLLTRLHPGVTPLIRYKVGDRGVLGSELCKCGRNFETLDSIKGREVDEIITPSGNKLIVHFFTGILEHFKEIDEFQVIQRKPNLLIIKIVPAKEIKTNTIQNIIDALKRKGADDVNIDIEVVSEIPLTSAGKRRFIVKELS